jgi:hypothetical protein
MTPAQMQALALRFRVLPTAVAAAADSAAAPAVAAESGPEVDVAALSHFVSRRWLLPSTLRRTLEQRYRTTLAPTPADAPAAPRTQADGALLVAAVGATRKVRGPAGADA